MRPPAIAQPVAESGSRPRRLLDEICFYLQNNYQEPITRDSVAAQFGVTPNHLSRIFHTQGHMTFINYLTHVRIARSKYLLCKYNLKLEDVGARCGFRDAPYFCRVFKRLTKITPAEYRTTSAEGSQLRLPAFSGISFPPSSRSVQVKTGSSSKLK